MTKTYHTAKTEKSKKCEGCLKNIEKGSSASIKLKNFNEITYRMYFHNNRCIERYEYRKSLKGESH